MNRHYTTFGLPRKNIAVWLSTAVLLLSAVLRVVYYCLGGIMGRNVWGFGLIFIAIPIGAVLLFSANAIVRGRDRLYATRSSVWLTIIFLLSRLFAICVFDPSVECPWWIIAASCAIYIATGFIWSLTANGARIRCKLPSIIACAVTAIHAVVLATRNFDSELNPLGIVELASTVLMPFALFITSCGLERLTSENYRPRGGDRCDGRKVRGLYPLVNVANYAMPSRTGASNYFQDSFDYADVDAYIRKKREEGLTNFGVMHLIVAAYVRVVSQKPEINRFISGQKIFTRDGEIELAMTIKKDMTAESPETIIKVYFSPDDTANDVYRKYNEQIEAVKNASFNSSFDKLAWVIDTIPGVFKKFAFWFLKLLDYFGCLPRALTRLSPFHGSIFITSMGSLGIPPIYHHLYDFGNIPVFIAFGARRSVNEVSSDGQVLRKKYVDYTVVVDERICDGYYYASAFKLIKRYISNPYRLDAKPEEVIKDIF